MTRRSEYSGMTIVVPANIGNHVIKYKRLLMSNGDFGICHVRIESHAPWTYKDFKALLYCFVQYCLVINIHEGYKNKASWIEQI